MNRRKLTLSQRLFIWLWRRLTNLMVGFPDRFAAEYVHTFGIREFLRWSQGVFKVVQQLEARYGGAAEAQMLISFAAMWCGCRWCGVGHLLSGNLELFRRDGVLGPLDERRIPELQLMRDPEVLAELERLFDAPRWQELREALRRQYLLRAGKVEESSTDDQLLQLTNFMWEWVNECSITALDIDPLQIPAQSPINKRRKLMELYQQARRRQRLTASD